MRYFNVIITVMFISAVASAQIDTLQLVEVGSIQAPSAITGLYVEDLDGDSLKEIVICTDSYVYIYNSQTYQVEWTSPLLNHPSDLIFKDINNNGLIDISVKDNMNIYLFDPHIPQTIWTSPELDNTYKCYTIGDRDDDGWIDVAIVKKEPFTRYDNPDNLDTMWVEIYDGPVFTEQSGFLHLLPNSNWFWNNYFWHYEEPVSITIERISGLDGTESRISIFYRYEDVWHSPYQNHRYSYINSGFLTIFDGLEMGQIHISASIGELLNFGYKFSGETIYLNTISSLSDSSSDYPWYHKWSVKTFLADSAVYSGDIYNWWASFWPDTVYWHGFIVNDFTDINGGLENCYSAEDTLVLLTFPVVDTLWIREVPYIDSVLHRFVDSSLYDSPQIICGMDDPLDDFRFFNGSDGSLSAVLPDSGYELSRVSDLENDQCDEILSIQDAGLVVYDLDYATGIDNETKLPNRAFLRPNYPNPFNSSTTIEYGLPEAGRVRIDIYDLLGRKVETVIDGEMPAGRHQAVWDASSYSSGVYFYRIEAGDFVDTKRMVFLK